MSDARLTPLPPTTVGVAYAEPGIIDHAIKAQVAEALASVPDGKKSALVMVATNKGWNSAFAARIGGGMQVVAWIGKSGWDQPFTGTSKGVYLKGAW